ncbi:MAG: PAS domain-containing protein [Candidatus Rokubacteria bacterium]|nr:PAS domain-containing protein [Candidatus Rokubacteria bacterium]
MKLLERLSRRIGGPRVLALPLIRALAIASGYMWVALAPAAYVGWDLLDTVMLGFLLYSLVVIGGLWLRPAAMLRLNSLVLLVDLAFALGIVHLTGGAHSTLFLALLLIAGLQSYYYGIKRGVLVAAGSAVAYVVVVVPTAADVTWADMAIRLSVLVGTAIGVGILADVEEAERLRVMTLSVEAREREAFIRSVVESLREGVIALDRAGRIVAWNHALEQRYGVPAADVLGRTLAEVNPEFAGGALAEPLARLLRGETEEFTVDGLEHRTLRRGPITLNVKGGLLRRSGQPVGGVLLLDDVTDRVALERAARQADKLAALGTLAAGLAHELNNPIGIISSRIELVLLETEAALAAEVREDLQVVHRHAQRVTRIVQGLLSFARQSTGAHAPVDLNDIVEETLLLIEKQVSKDRITLVRTLAPGLPPIRGDVNALQQVLMNLVLNARDALDHAGRITVETGPVPGAPDRVRLSVSDTGRGIPPELLSRIFDPFFTTKPSGTGLGLAISYGIVRDHQGAFEVRSEPGQGATFSVTFPTTAAEVVA